MTKILNDHSQKNLRRELRKNLPQPEIRLWAKLRAGRMHGCKFRRQYSVGPYVVDFYCPAAKLVIEIDGESHFGDLEAIKRDEQRQAYIEKQKLKVVRFTNTEIRGNFEGVIRSIETHLPKPLLSRGGDVSDSHPL